MQVKGHHIPFKIRRNRLLALFERMTKPPVARTVSLHHAEALQREPNRTIDVVAGVDARIWPKAMHVHRSAHPKRDAAYLTKLLQGCNELLVIIRFIV